jgi:hypothetical protein
MESNIPPINTWGGFFFSLSLKWQFSSICIAQVVDCLFCKHEALNSNPVQSK